MAPVIVEPLTLTITPLWCGDDRDSGRCRVDGGRASSPPGATRFDLGRLPSSRHGLSDIKARFVQRQDTRVRRTWRGFGGPISPRVA